MLKELYLLWLRLAAPQDLHYINGPTPCRRPCRRSRSAPPWMR